ncbi:MAG: hypothetical protein QNJ74_14210 [Trichodesmium sp. MO_231.B1]|nr:hypothetical protein [Trichodesmium sp. MO_231.B1]
MQKIWLYFSTEVQNLKVQLQPSSEYPIDIVVKKKGHSMERPYKSLRKEIFNFWICLIPFLKSIATFP